MQTTLVKYDIISWITKLNDERIIQKLHQWVAQQEPETLNVDEIIPPRREGSLTEGFGFWAENTPFNETNYRDQLWQTEKNTW